MPRVATGFISFLSLQVFRSMAYSLIPKPTYTLLWVDVIMFVVTEILFGAVLENIAAQFLRTNVSSHVANRLDKLARWGFPCVTLVVLSLLFAMGSAQITPGKVMIAAQCVLGASFVLLVVSMYMFARRLPLMLMKLFVNSGNALASGKNRDPVVMDKIEMAVLFTYIDSSQTGFATAEQCVMAFEQHGLIFQSKTARENYRQKLEKIAQSGGFQEFDVDNFSNEFSKVLKSMRSAEKRKSVSGAAVNDAKEAVKQDNSASLEVEEMDGDEEKEDDSSVMGL
eukprot:TRINITY_DN5010_c0_g1_i2.p1 TRINITY_DN5010_c0_g1~~TRINITY_DN5010_c0_g1_i2.p1  ORF type:complete len:296 (+),score=56.69 TRINITY_DN5010_c0_g1_i2:43-888(+)